MNTFSGTLKVKGNTKQVSDKFKIREFVLTDGDHKYPQSIQFQLTQDRCMLLDDFNIGDEMEVTFNLRGREWVNPKGETKYFNSLDVFRINGESNRNIDPQENDDLPF